MDRLPTLARRRRTACDWWRPGLPVHPRVLDDDLTVADVVLADRRRCWHLRPADDIDPEDGAMRWTPELPPVRFR